MEKQILHGTFNFSHFLASSIAISPEEHNILQPSIDMSYLSISNADKLN